MVSSRWKRSLPFGGAAALLLAVAWFTPVGEPFRAGAAWTPMRWERIDIHTHFYQNQPFIIPVLDAVNIRRAAILNYMGMDDPPERVEYETRIRALRDEHPDRFVYCPTIDVSQIDAPDYVQQVLRAIEGHVANGARGLKVWKVLGMKARDASGKLVPIDDARLEPIWTRLEELRLPIIIHAAEPIDAWLPLDPTSAHHGYFANNREWYFHGRADVYSHAQLMEQRDSVVARHPRLTVIANHLASLEHDLPGLAARFAKYPNLHAETGARFVNFIRTPRETMRAFFIQHQDRLLFGSDWTTRPGPVIASGSAAYAAQQKKYVDFYEAQFRYLETDDEVTFGGVTGRGLALPEEVLRKLYWTNAKRLIPGI